MSEAERILKDFLSRDTKFQYMMLDRLRQDALYFLGAGGRHEKHLYTGNVNDHIEVMKGIHDHLEVKPEWLTMEELLELESKMKQQA